MTWREPVTRGALLLMESLWVYALVAFLVALAGDPGNPSLVAAAAVVILSFAISRLLQETELSLGLLRAWGTAMSLLLFYAIVRLDFFGDLRLWDFAWSDQLANQPAKTIRENDGAVIGIVTLWCFWMRGVLRGQQSIGFDAVIGSFGIGVGVIALTSLLAEQVEAPGLVGGVAVPFVAVGLLAIALAHASRAEVDIGRSFARTWLVAVGGALLLFGLFAFLLVLVDAGQAAGLLDDAARGVGWGAYQVLYYTLWPFVMAAEFLGQFIRDLLGSFWRDTPPPQQEGGEQELDEKSFPGWIKVLAQILGGGVVVALVLLGTALLFSRFVRRRRPGGLKESVYTEGRLSSDIGDLLGNLLGRLRPSLRFGGAAYADAIRRLYFEMLSLAARRGVQRHTGETPLELSPRLTAAFESQTPSGITSAFDDVRYGGLAPPEAEVSRLREEWEALKRRPTT